MIKNILKLLFGSLLAKLIGIAAMPILTRLYSPEDFGAMSILAASIAVIGPLVTLRLVDAIPLPKNNIVALNLFFLNFLLTITSCFMLAVIMCISVFSGFDGSEYFRPSNFIFVILGVLFFSIYEILSTWAIRSKDYSIISKTQVHQALIGAIVKLIFGFLYIGKYGLIIGHIAQQAGGSYTLLKRFDLHKLKSFGLIHINIVRRVWKRYIDYPKFRLPSQLLLVVAQQLPIIYVATFHSITDVGQLSLAISMLSLPVMIIVNNVRKVYYGEIAKVPSSNTLELKVITLSLAKKMFLLGLFPCAILFLTSELIFSFAFGSRWADAGVYASWYSIYMVFLFTVGPIINIFNVLGIQKSYLIINVVRFLSVLSVLIYSYLEQYLVIDFVILYSLVMAGFYALIFLYVLYVLYALDRANCSGG